LSILTKIFVVLVTLLSVVLVALIVPFVAKVEDYRSQLQQAEQVRTNALATARLRQAEISALKDKENERFTALTAEIAKLTGDLAKVEEDLAIAKANYQSAQAGKAKDDANIARLTAAHEQFAAITAGLQDELTQRREQAVKLETASLQLKDRNFALESQLDALTREVRKLRENMTQLAERNTELETIFERLDPTVKQDLLNRDQDATASRPVFMPQTKIAGKITEVEQIDDETFVEVNVGSNDGVEANMKFWVHRAGQYLGTLVITRVDANAAAGRMMFTEQDISGGDEVLTGGTF